MSGLDERQGKMTPEEVNANGELSENLCAAVERVVADFLENTNHIFQLDRLYIAITMAYEDKLAETMPPLIYWKTTSGLTVGNDASDGLTFGSHMRVHLKPTCTDLYIAVADGLLGKGKSE